MKKTSPRSHLYQLGIVLVASVIGFIVVKSFAMPRSWNYEVWYRQDALGDMEHLPLIHGGNESCIECHEEEYNDATSYEHKTLNCEGCHGPLTFHVRDGEKIANATGKSNWQCLNCHEEEISRPKDHPQFPGDVRRHEDLLEDSSCVRCHDPHDPSV